MTSTSARRMASAIASQPVASCSVSTSLDSRGLTSTAITPAPRARPAASPPAPLLSDSLLAGDPLVARSFVTSGGGRRVRGRVRVGRACLTGRRGPYLGVRRDPALLLEPFVVPVVVLLPELPLVVVVFELELVDHDDAVLHRADLCADTASDAGLVDDLVMAFRRYLEALVRAVQPAHRALDARVEVDHRTQRPRRVFLVLRIALAGLAGVDDDAWTHGGPAGLFELEHLVAARALARLHRAELRAVEAELRRLHGALVLGLFLDQRFHVFEADPVRHHLRERAQNAVIGVIVLEDPETGERCAAGDDDERVRSHGRVGLGEHFVRRVLAGDEQEAVLAHRLPDRLAAVPGPRLNALDERVVDGDRHVDDGRLVLRHRRLELEIVDRDDRELLGRHAVALRGVAVARERGAGVAALARGEHD